MSLHPIAVVATMLLSAGSPPSATPAGGFAPGEQIDLAVEYLNLPTGKARITVGHPEGKVWPVVCQGRTDGVASLIDVREHFVSYWDSAAGLPRGSALSAVEVGDRHVDISRYDRAKGKATVLIQRKGRRSEKTYPIPSDVQDVASALMALRSKPLAPGEHVEMPVFTGSETSTLVADVIGRERVQTPAGKFDTIKVKVRTAFNGQFKSRRDSFLWFSDDPRHVPVRMSAELALGHVVANLTGYKAGGEVARR